MFCAEPTIYLLLLVMEFKHFCVLFDHYHHFVQVLFIIHRLQPEFNQILFYELEKLLCHIFADIRPSDCGGTAFPECASRYDRLVYRTQ